MKKNLSRKSALNRKLIALAVASCFATGLAYANPTAPTVVHGSAAFQQAGNLLQITNSPNAIINWGSFSIGASEITRFIQQSQASAVLNRVIGQDPSSILGALQSNGRVFLINPNGILFGAGAQIDVAGLVASTLNLSNADFLAGRLRFTEVPGAGSILNQGNITTQPGGNVYLVAPDITNSGIITSPKGEVALAAGKSVELVNPGTPNLRVEITAPDNEARNLGQIVADSGKVGIYAGLINHSGTIRADSAVVGENGQILLKATKNVTVESGSLTSANGPSGGRIEIQSGDTTLIAGTLEAKGTSIPSLSTSESTTILSPLTGEGEDGGNVGTGGTVHVLGNLVGVTDNARIDASGDTGGGTVLVGGDFQGKNPEIQNAYRTYFGPNASIAADAITNGDGGKVIVWSDDATHASGTISAKGGATAGNGGFVEVSGKDALQFRSLVDVRAPQGVVGTLLLDPKNITINTTGLALLSDVSSFLTNASADSFINAATINAATGAVTMQANNDITVAAPVSIIAPVSLTMQAGRSVVIQANVTTNNANLTITANDSAAQAADRDAGAGGITMAAGTTLNAGTGTVALTVGPGVSGAASGNLVVENIIAANVNLQQNGGTSGSSILRASSSSLIQATNLLMEVDHPLGTSGGSVGTSAAPMRIQASVLESHTHEASPGIFIEAPNAGDLQIGGVPFFSGFVKGVQNVTSGDISLSVNGTLTLQAGTAGCGATGGTGGPICTGGSTIALNANDMSLGNVVNATATGTVTLAPFSTSRDIKLEGPTPTVGTLSLNTSELQKVTAGTLEIGRSTDTGTLTVATALDSSNVNASTFKLAHQNIAINQPITFSTGNENLTLTAGASGAVSLAADLNVGTGVIDASASTLDFSGTRTITSTNSGTGFSAGTLNIDSTDSVSLNATSSADTINLSGGVLTGLGDVTVDRFVWTRGKVSGTGAFTVGASGALFENTTPGALQMNLDGRAVTVNGPFAMAGTAWLDMTNGATLTVNGSAALDTSAISSSFFGIMSFSGAPSTVNFLGGVTKTGSQPFDLAVRTNTAGTVRSQQGEFTFDGGFVTASKGGDHTGTNFVADSGAFIKLANGTHQAFGNVTFSGAGFTQVGEVSRAAVLSKDAAATVTNMGTMNFTPEATLSAALTNQGTLNLNGTTVSGALTNGGTVNVNGSLTASAGMQQQSGTLFIAGGKTFTIGGSGFDWQGGTLSGPGSLVLPPGSSFNVMGILDVSSGGPSVSASTMNILSGGTLMGSGTVNANVNNSAGTVAPGASAGILTINGGYVQGPGGVLAVDIGGTSAGTQYDQLVVTGNVTLGGTLNTTLINSFVPASSDTFTVIQSSGTVTGAFATTTGASVTPTYLASSVDLKVLTQASVPGEPQTTPLLSAQISGTEQLQQVAAVEQVSEEVSQAAIAVKAEEKEEEKPAAPPLCR